MENNGIQTIEIKPWEMIFPEDITRDKLVRTAAEYLAETILVSQYPILKDTLIIHKWDNDNGKDGLRSYFDAPSVIQYVKPTTTEDLFL